MSGINEQDLRRAVEPVSDYFHGTKLTPGTVLAAYLRAAGMSAGGKDWRTAKRAFEAGFTFEEAVAEALSQSDVRGTRSSQISSGVPALAPIQKISRTTGAISGTEYRDDQSDGIDTPTAGAWASSGPPSSSRSSLPQTEGGITSSNSNMQETNLSWFPKVCGPGDLMGPGAKKLLGQPKLLLADLLVRETAQNSWDARSGDGVEFVVNLKKVSAEQLRVLRTSVFTGRPEGLGLLNALNQEELWVLEISDRGTKGLGGPVRNDLPVSPLEPTDFIDFVFNVGAPRDVRLGAGTYGFGKTVGFLTSGCGSTLIWSRCEVEGGFENRLIGSAIGGAYEDDEHRFTGRHWWGIPQPEAAGIAPASGQLAACLGEALFDRSFQSSETGTSLLIIDPQLGGESRLDDAQRLGEAVLWNLWPKMTPREDGSLPMLIEVQLDGEPIPLTAPDEHPVLKHYVACLKAIRAAQSTSSLPDVHLPLGVLEEVWTLNPRKLLGHLAMTRFVLFNGESEYSADPEFMRDGSHHVCLMRNEAELVVKYERRYPLDQAGYHWAAVFKPVPGTDDSFALAEPPAHDDWVPESISDRKRKSEVNVALRRIQQLTNKFITPVVHEPDIDTFSREPSVGLAQALGSIMAEIGGLPESPKDPRGKRSSRRSNKRKPQIGIHQQQLIESPYSRSKRAQLVLDVENAPGAYARVSAHILAAVEGGQERLPADSLNVEWSTPTNDWRTHSEQDGERYTFTAPTDVQTTLTIDFPDDLAIDVDVRVGD